MTLPDEARARADLRARYRDLFASAEQVHNAAVEIVTRGHLTIRNAQGFHPGVRAVLLSLYTKACKTFRAVQLTCGAGLGQDAAVLARELFETEVAVLFILQTESRQRASMIAAHQDQRLLVLLEQAAKTEGLRHLGSAEACARARGKVRAWDAVLPADLVDSVRRHWSGRGLEWAAAQVGLADAYGTMYRVTSSFAHASDVKAHIFAKEGEMTPTFKLAPGDDMLKPILVSTMDILRVIAMKTNDAFGLGEDATVQVMTAEVAKARGGES